jgi:hypothetical protein
MIGGSVRPNPVPLREVRPLAKEFVDVLRGEFQKLIDDPQFVEKLTTIERLAVHARELALTLGDLGPMRLGHAGQAAGEVVNPVYIGPQENSGYGIGFGSYSMSGGLATASPEQFGARAIRELVGLAPEIASQVAKAFQTPKSIIDAIASARERGLTALADKLEAKLLARVDETEAPPSEAPHHHENTHQNGAEPTAPLHRAPALDDVVEASP